MVTRYMKVIKGFLLKRNSPRLVTRRRLLGGLSVLAAGARLATERWTLKHPNKSPSTGTHRNQTHILFFMRLLSAVSLGAQKRSRARSRSERPHAVQVAVRDATLSSRCSSTPRCSISVGTQRITVAFKRCHPTVLQTMLARAQRDWYLALQVSSVPGDPRATSTREPGGMRSASVGRHGADLRTEHDRSKNQQ